MDWNLRNPFCATCGSKTIPVHAGWKRMCPPKDNAHKSAPRPECATRGRISNVSFPRTDPTVIAAVVNSSGNRILLGRQRVWPKGMYSTLAGFVEPGESLEEAVRREVWEESGVSIGRVMLVSSQPWPFPGGLMIGAIAVGKQGEEDIHLGHDPELEHAKWFTREEISEALRHGVLGLGRQMLEVGKDKRAQRERDGKMWVPPPTAIANRLITQALGFLEDVSGAKI